MNESLENLAKRLKKELGLVANVVSADSSVKIVGGTEYDERGGIGLYVKKYEVVLVENNYQLKLPLGQTFIDLDCESEDVVIEKVKSHFGKYYPSIKLVCKGV